MKHLASLLLVVAVLPACKSKKTEHKPVATPGSASGTAADPPPPPPATVKTVTVPAGVANFGCLGWSKSEKAAACITGESALGEDAKFELRILDTDDPPAKITIKKGEGEDMFDDVTAANALLAKLKIEPFDGTPTQIEPGKTTDLGNGASIDWKAKETNKGGDNQAPTVAHEVTVTCPTKATAQIVKVESEGTNPEIRVWSVHDHLVIDLETHIGREGESRRTSTPMLISLADCK